MPVRIEWQEQAAKPSRPALQSQPADVAWARAVVSGKPGIILAGYGCGDADAILDLARILNVPVLADPLSDLRFRPGACQQVVAGYDQFLAGAKLPDLAWTLRFGQMPVSKRLSSWLATLVDAAHLVVESRGRWSDPLAHATRMIHADTTGFCHALPDATAGAVRFAPHTASARRSYFPLILDLLPDDSLLFVGNSLAIRQFSGSHAPAWEPSLRLQGAVCIPTRERGNESKNSAPD